MMCIAAAVCLCGCGGVYSSAKKALDPDAAVRIVQRARAADEQEALLHRDLQGLHDALSGPGSPDRISDAADRAELHTFELERAALAVKDMGEAARETRADRQCEFALAARKAIDVCREGPPERAIAAIESAFASQSARAAADTPGAS